MFSIKQQSEQILLGKKTCSSIILHKMQNQERWGGVINVVKRGRDVACSDSTHRAVVLLLQQGGNVSSDGHLLGQILVLHTDPPPQLLQETQQTRPALGTGLQVGSAKAHIFVGPQCDHTSAFLTANVHPVPAPGSLCAVKGKKKQTSKSIAALLEQMTRQ